MTQEEKAKRYDEVLEELRGLLECVREEKCKILEEDITSIFPELKESEDEKIRKALIRTFNEQRINEHINGVLVGDILAWLEKQEEQKQDPCDNCKDVMLNCHNFPCIEKRAFKQGKTALEAINEEKVDNANKVETKDYSSIDPHFGKPIDKVEPKFKNGQWIVWQDKCYKVNYNGCGYELVDQNGLSTSLEYGTIDENAHIWDISKDAKAGDILYTPKGLGVEGIFLVSGWQQIEGTGKTLCSNIGYRVDDDEIVEGGLGAIWWKGVVDTYYPATKEQRELLFHKMEEAGYEWDVDKKELKNIKDEIEIPFGAKDSELIAESYYIPKGFHAEIDKDKVVIKKGEKPTEWSEKHIADVFEKVGLAKIVREQSNDALTIALQDAMIELSKVTLQPKPTTWSEEDESWFKEMELMCLYFSKDTDYRAEFSTWLKSLKDRVKTQQEWTMQDEEELQIALDTLVKAGQHSSAKWLKNVCLVPQNKWKPSDAQIKALEHFVRSISESGYSSPYGNNTKLLYSLLEDLKKLK